MNARLGLLLRTGSLEEALACAALMSADVIRDESELQPDRRVLVDLALTDVNAAVRIGERFRSLGIELIVTARPLGDVPFELRRNLTGLTGATAA